MTLETDIVAALRASHATHETILAEIAKLKGETGALRAIVAELENKVATLEAAAVDVVEPALAQPVIDDLMRHVEALHAALRPAAAAEPPPASIGEPDAPSAPAEAPAPTATTPTPVAPEALPAEAVPALGARSSARAWIGLGAATEVSSVPATPDVPASSRLSRFGFRSG